MLSGTLVNNKGINFKMNFQDNLKPVLMLVWMIICFNCIVIEADGQELILKEKNRYRYQSNLYKYGDLKDVLIKSESAYDHYKVYKSSNLKAKIFGYTSLGLIATGVVIGEFMPDTDCSSGGVCSNQVYGILIGLAGIIPGTIGVVYKIKAGKHKRRSISIFNNKVHNEEISLKIGTSPNGVGIVIIF